MIDDGADADGRPVDESNAATEADAETVDGDAETADLASRVAAHDEALAAEVSDLRDRVDRLESELRSRDDRIEDLESRLKRKQADFQNYKKRAKQREEDVRERATEDLVERLVSVRDNLVRALDQDESANIRDGVESTLETFDRVLEEENVETIDPDAGDEVDPTRHEVMLRVESDHPAGTVVDVYRPGYEMGGRVIQTAQVTVSEGE